MDIQTIELIAKELMAEPGLKGFVFEGFQLQNAMTWCVDFSIEGRIIQVCGDNEPGMTRESVKKEMKEKLLDEAGTANLMPSADTTRAEIKEVLVEEAAKLGLKIEVNEIRSSLGRAGVPDLAYVLQFMMGPSPDIHQIFFERIELEYPDWKEFRRRIRNGLSQTPQKEARDP